MFISTLRPHRAPRRTAFLLMSVLFLPAALTAQTSILQGRVVEDGREVPIEAVLVTLLSAEGDDLDQVLTGDDGRFSFTVDDHERIRLRGERIGYRDTTTPVLHLEGRRLFEVEVRLSTEAVLLAPLEVVAWSEPSTPYTTDFEHRRRRGVGRYITRETIEERDPAYVTDLLATVPGVRLLSQGRGSRRSVVMGRANDCRASIWVDGILVNRGPVGSDVTVDDVVSPESVYGIEVYRGPSTVPADFVDDAACGAVVIWTRRSPLR